MENPQSSLMRKLIREEYIEVEPNVRLHITDAGDGRPVVLIHGWPLSDEMFEYQYIELLKNNFRIIGITLRGFGKSDKPYSEYNYDIHSMDIKKVINKLGIENAVMLGFSMGGAIAARYVSADKGAHISKLILCAAALPCWTQRDNFPFNLSKQEVDELIALNYSDRPQLLENFSKIFSATVDSLSEGLRKWLFAIGLSASSYATANCLVTLRDSDLRKDLENIKIPSLILHGKKDKICSFQIAEQTQLMLENSSLIPFENSGHSLFLEERQKFNDELIRFSSYD